VSRRLSTAQFRILVRKIEENCSRIWEDSEVEQAFPAVRTGKAEEAWHLASVVLWAAAESTVGAVMDVGVVAVVARLDEDLHDEVLSNDDLLASACNDTHYISTTQFCNFL